MNTSRIRYRQLLISALTVATVLSATLPALAGKPSGGGTTTITTNPLAEQAGVKVLVRQDGWYQFTRQDAIDAGWDPGSSSPGYLQLWADGVQQAMLVNAGADSSFDPSDTIQFYGTGLDTPATGTRVYWLTRSSSLGLRIAQLSAGRGKSGPTSFNDTVTLAPNTMYVPGITGGSADGFYGGMVSSTPVSHTITATDLAASASATPSLEVSLQGTPLWSHSVAVSINGNSAGTMTFYNGQALTSVFSVPISWLVSGANTVTLTAQNGAADTSLITSIKLTYPRLFKASSDSLAFTAGGGLAVTVANFSSASVRVLDITNPATPQQLSATITAVGGSYSATLTTPSSSGNRTLLAIVASKTLSPAGIVANSLSSLAATTNQADLVILAAPEFVSAAAPLESLRRQEGLLVATLDVTDVYDTFSYGAKDPQAIKTFLQYTTTKWSKAPRYVLLVGGASLDPRNYFGYGELDFVPTKFITAAGSRTASDDWFVDFANDGLPDMAIGRLPARSASDAATAVSKIVGYAQSTGSWTNSILLAADQNDQYNNFETSSAAAAAMIPSTFAKQNAFAGQIGASAASSAISDGFNTGRLVIDYTGHGFQQAWSSSGLLTVGGVQALTNASQLSFVVSIACLTGYLQDPTSTSLAASLVNAPNGGAVAMWASSGSIELAGESAMNQKLLSVLFNGTRPAIGDAVVQAKTATADQDARKTYILFGDPSMRLAQ